MQHLSLPTWRYLWSGLFARLSRVGSRNYKEQWLAFITSHWPLWLFIMAFTPRVLLLAADPLWYDETFTAWITALPLPRMLSATAGDVHPPLWYLITWLTRRVLGGSVFALRLPAAIFSSLAAVAAYRLVDDIAGKRPALLAGLFMAWLPGMFYYGREARMYALLVYLVLLAARALLAWRWFSLAVLCALVLYTQNLGVLFVAAIYGFALFVSWRHALLSGALSGLLFTPWLPVLLRQAGDVGDGFWIPPMGNAGGMFYWLFYGTAWSTYDPLLIHAALAVAAVTVVALYFTLSQLFDFRRDAGPNCSASVVTGVGRRRETVDHNDLHNSGASQLPGDICYNRAGLALLLVLAIVPAGVLGAASVLWRPLMLPRALLPGAAAMVCLWSLAIVDLDQRQPKAARLVLVTLLPLLASGFVYQADRALFDVGRNDIGYVYAIQKGWQPGDVVYHANLASLITTHYYLPDYEQYVLPNAGDLAQSLTEDTKDSMGIRAMQSDLSDLVGAGYRRAWLLVVDTPVSGDHERRQVARLMQDYPVSKRIMIFDYPLAHFELAVLELN